ncbi:MAG: N-acetylneuraminate synthase family protein [Planctomycetes bacterium]|nr:N-acetylneuraminate synthase family protein [Planctomycetota bacterium]
MYLPWEKPKPPIRPAHVVAEIGCNHLGRVDIAKELIRAARVCGASVVKSQKRNPRVCLTPEEYAAPHPNPAHAFGATYGAHREALELSAAQHAELLAFAAAQGVQYTVSVWDEPSAHEMIALDVPYLKVPSARNTDWELLRILRDEYAGPLHVSSGMAERDDIEALIRFFEETGQARRRLVVYACTSGYPVPFHEVCLLEIRRLREQYGARVREIGFSGHHLGIAVDVAAFALGAAWIERHFTLDRTWKGTDHAASLEPSGLARLCRDIEAVALAWRDKPAEMMAIERVQFEKLKGARFVCAGTSR